MNEEIIQELIKLKIKEHFKQDKKYYRLDKEQLLDFCIKLLKEIEKY
mgnify:FL=1